jgi:phage tail sheath protein FI
MPVTPTYPGVYIQEIPSGVRTITGVATSITALIGYTQRGPTNKAVQLFNFGDFERQFGGLASASDLSYAVQQYFLNGGNEAWVVRVASGAAAAGISLKDAVSQEVLDVVAYSHGVWGNNLRISVDHDTINPNSLFNMTITEFIDQNGTLQQAHSETFRNLSMNSKVSNYAVDVINAGSSLIQVKRTAAALVAVNAAAPGTSISGDLSTFTFSKLDDDHRRLAITINGEGPFEFDLFNAGGSLANLGALATAISGKVTILSPSQGFTAFTCTASATGITCTAGTTATNENSSVHFTNAGIRNAAGLLKLGLSNGGKEVDSAATIMPVATGTLGGDLSSLNLTTLVVNDTLDVTIHVGAVAGSAITIHNLWATKPTSLAELRSMLAAALAARSEAELSGARVSLIANRLQVEAGSTNPNAFLVFTNGGGTTADLIGLSAAGGAVSNVAAYSLGLGLTSQAQDNAVPGNDGSLPGSGDLIGHRADKTGIFALEDVDLFNILCVPNVSDNSVLAAALAYCDERRAFMIIDMDSKVDSVDKAKQWLTTNSDLRDNNSATYFPRMMAADPLQNFRLRPFAPSGALAGLYARTDADRGVWKAPAGTDAVLRGVQGLTYKLTDAENGVLNQLGLNCLRTFPVYGNIAWGARTLNGSDVQASEWKYIPVRRFALFLEESLFRGTKWVVFEPNDEPLWAQIRLNLGAFMQSLFRQGAFQGTSPRDAYFVKCDKETTTQTDINNGIVNIVVGFAPLKPAEFVILKIQQIAGQIPV